VWSISRNAVEFVGEYREPGQPISFRLVGETEEILTGRIKAWHGEREKNGRE
jgi:hypothetical protein